MFVQKENEDEPFIPWASAGNWQSSKFEKEEDSCTKTDKSVVRTASKERIECSNT
jgi:hypothetical protein